MDLSKVSKYGWNSAILALILLLGSSATSPSRRSISNSFSFGVCYNIGVILNLGNADFISDNFKASGQLFSLGVPRTLKILKIWSISLSPVNNGFNWAISAKMQPVLQISTPREYYFLQRRISGHLYQRVTTSCVYV